MDFVSSATLEQIFQLTTRIDEASFSCDLLTNDVLLERDSTIHRVTPCTFTCTSTGVCNLKLSSVRVFFLTISAHCFSHVGLPWEQHEFYLVLCGTEAFHAKQPAPSKLLIILCWGVQSNCRTARTVLYDLVAGLLCCPTNLK